MSHYHIELNLIGSYSNQFNWVIQIDDIQIQTLICVIQLGLILYGNGTCHNFHHRHHRNIFRWTKTFSIYTNRMIDHQDHCSQNPPVTPSSIWWQPIKTKSEPLDAATSVIVFFCLEL